MKTTITLILTILSFALLPSCETPGDVTSGLFVAYTGTGLEVSNMNITAEPGQEAVTANGVGYNTKLKRGYVTFVDGHRMDLKVTGGGFGGGVAALILENGSRISVNVKTGKVTFNGSPWDPTVLIPVNYDLQ